jgi:protein-disulfide isomerase-like protein with CxxC motif
MSSLPNWVLYLQALSTPAIAILAAVIGFMQWRTAHQRSVLDLFEKRFDVYIEIRAVIAQVLTHGTVADQQSLDFLRAIDKAQFLFGPEVTAYLNSVYRLLVDHGLAESMMKAGGADYQKAVEKKYAAFREISQFYVRSLPLVQPYMRMHQKAPRI